MEVGRVEDDGIGGGALQRCRMRLDKEERLHLRGLSIICEWRWISELSQNVVTTFENVGQ